MKPGTELQELKALRAIVEEHQSQIHALMRSDGYLVQAQSSAREQMVDLQLEFCAISDCLRSRGLLDHKELHARLRTGRSPRTLFRVLNEPEAASLLVVASGRRAAARLCAASSSCAENLPGALRGARVDSGPRAPREQLQVRSVETWAMGCLVSVLRTLLSVHENCAKRKAGPSLADIFSDPQVALAAVQCLGTVEVQQLCWASRTGLGWVSAAARASGCAAARLGAMAEEQEEEAEEELFHDVLQEPEDIPAPKPAPEQDRPGLDPPARPASPEPAGELAAECPAEDRPVSDPPARPASPEPAGKLAAECPAEEPFRDKLEESGQAHVQGKLHKSLHALLSAATEPLPMEAAQPCRWLQSLQKRNSRDQRGQAMELQDSSGAQMVSKSDFGWDSAKRDIVALIRMLRSAGEQRPPEADDAREPQPPHTAAEIGQRPAPWAGQVGGGRRASGGDAIGARSPQFAPSARPPGGHGASPGFMPGAAEDKQSRVVSGPVDGLLSSPVMLQGLKKRSDLNGQTCQLLRPDDRPPGFCHVMLDTGEAVRVEASNMAPPKKLREAKGDRRKGRGQRSGQTAPDRPPCADDDRGTIIICGGLNEYGTLDEVESFDIATGVWSPLPPMRRPRGAAGSATVDGCLYVVGGEQRSQVLGARSKELQDVPHTFDSVEVFDPALGRWEQGPPLTEARAMPVLFVHGRRLYAFGGRGEHSTESIASAECLDPGATSWRRVTPMKTGRMLPSTGVLGGKFYICGGSDGCRRPAPGCWNGIPLPTAECFDPATERWTELASMSRARFLSGTAEMGEHLYICGGMDSMATSQRHVERFNPRIGRWEVVTRMRQPRSGPSAAGVTVNGKQLLFVCGGHYSDTLTLPSFDSVVPNVECFMPSRGVWEVVSTMPWPRSLSASVVKGKYLYIIGGTDDYTTLSSAVRMNVENCSWEILEPMEKARFQAAMGSFPAT